MDRDLHLLHYPIEIFYMKNPLQITFKWLLVIIFSFFHIYGFSQNTSSEVLKIEIELSNPSKEINDGIAEAKVSGGIPPYEYKWSNKNTALDASTSTGLTEGVEYSLKVTDANGQTATEHFKLKAKAITEIFNSAEASTIWGVMIFLTAFSHTNINRVV